MRVGGFLVFVGFLLLLLLFFVGFFVLVWFLVGCFFFFLSKKFGLNLSVLQYFLKITWFCSFIGHFRSRKKTTSEKLLYFLTKNYYVMIIMEYLVLKSEEL